MLVSLPAGSCAMMETAWSVRKNGLGTQDFTVAFATDMHSVHNQVHSVTWIWSRRPPNKSHVCRDLKMAGVHGRPSQEPGNSEWEGSTCLTTNKYSVYPVETTRQPFHPCGLHHPNEISNGRAVPTVALALSSRGFMKRCSLSDITVSATQSRWSFSAICSRSTRWFCSARSRRAFSSALLTPCWYKSFAFTWTHLVASQRCHSHRDSHTTATVQQLRKPN